MNNLFNTTYMQLAQIAKYVGQECSVRHHKVSGILNPQEAFTTEDFR